MTTLYSAAIAVSTDSTGKRKTTVLPYGNYASTYRRSTPTEPSTIATYATSVQATPTAPSTFEVQLATSQAERRGDKAVHATELRAAQDRLNNAVQLVQAKSKIDALQNAQPPRQTVPAPPSAYSYFSQIVQLLIVVLLCLILFKLGCLRCTVSFGPLALKP